MGILVLRRRLVGLALLRHVVHGWLGQLGLGREPIRGEIPADNTLEDRMGGCDATGHCAMRKAQFFWICEREGDGGRASAP